MRMQDQIVRMTHKALDDICRAALAVPPELREVSPGGEARSVLSQMQEIAMSSQWFIRLIQDGKDPDFGGHAAREFALLRKSFDSVERCVEAARKGNSELCNVIAAMEDADLESEHEVPFFGGSVMTRADILLMPYWNMTYHLGQISMFQLIHGDKSMH